MNLIRRLQGKPYEQKIWLLKMATVVTIIFIIIIWAITLKFRATEKADTSKFQQIWKNIKELGSKFRN